MLRRVALVRTDVSEERSASIIRVTKIDELGTLAVTSNRRNATFVKTDVSEERSASIIRVIKSTIFVILMMEALRFSETSGQARATRYQVHEGIFN
jgi:hypothetical protein